MRIDELRHIAQLVARSYRTPAQHERQWRRIERKIARLEHPQNHYLWIAAAVVVVTCCVWLLRQSESQRGIAKIHDVPTLTLSDGRTLELTSNAAVGEELVFNQQELRYKEPLAGEHTLSVPRGAEVRVRLADGTMVHLNAASELTYPAAFVSSERRVRLSGEALFEVTKDAEHPFFVEAGGMVVQVAGTTFGVRARKGEALEHTVLTEGAVVVRAGSSEQRLAPNQQATFDTRTGVLTRQEANADAALAWSRGRLAYHGATLGEIFDDLGQWYDFELMWSDPALRELSYEIDIRRHNDFNRILEVLSATRTVQFTTKGRTIVVSGK